MQTPLAMKTPSILKPLHKIQGDKNSKEAWSIKTNMLE